MKAYVVMGNDYPDKVLLSEEVAEKYCAEQKAIPTQTGTMRIYWRHYEFDLDATTICGPDAVTFPATREQQANDLMALAGDALLRGDRIAWSALFRASKELEFKPEYDSDEGRRMSDDISARISETVR